ncbi:MAG: SDR family NAD(P)-dependent oxidoreductase [Thermoplasmata archaeon]
MRALVTGGSRGIGSATARRLAADGWELAIHGFRHSMEAEALAQELARPGVDHWAVTGDLADRSAVARIADRVLERWPTLDALILNGGSYPRASFADLDPDRFDACLRTNLTGPVELTRRLLPALKAAPAGRIVAVTSILAFDGSRRGAHYAAAKAGLVGWARSLARELAPSIRVNLVAPGPIDTDILAADTPEQRAARERAIPLGRIGRPEEVAAAIAFLVSPGANFITGATIHVNGGLRIE